MILTVQFRNRLCRIRPLVKKRSAGFAIHFGWRLDTMLLQGTLHLFDEAPDAGSLRLMEHL